MSQSQRKSLQGSNVFTSKPKKDANANGQKKISTDTKKNGSVEEQKHVATADKAVSKPQKAGFYLPEDLIDQLDLTWFEMRRSVGRRLNKSDIVRVAIQEALNDYAKKGEKSKIVTTLKS